MNPDRLAELEDERRFLLRSLRDLDAELAAGDVDVDDYETLRDGYTKRAADVLRDIEEGKRRAAARPPAPLVAAAGRRRGGVAVARRRRVVRGPLVGAAAGRRDRSHRRRGRTTSPSLLAQARALLGVDPVRAQALYERGAGRAARIIPRRWPTPGWLLFTASAGASEELRATASRTAEEQLARAVAADARTPTRTASWPSSPPTPRTRSTTARTERDRASPSTRRPRCARCRRPEFRPTS